MHVSLIWQIIVLARPAEYEIDSEDPHNDLFWKVRKWAAKLLDRVFER